MKGGSGTSREYRIQRSGQHGQNLWNKEGVDMKVNILEAKTNLSNLVRMVETGEEETIVIVRYGKPVVKMTV